MNEYQQFHQIDVSYDETLLKNRSEPQSVSITTRDFFKKYYPRLYDWDWDSYFEDKEGFYKRIPTPLSGRLWYKGPVDFMDACYLRPGMVACVSEKVKEILADLQINNEEYYLHPITISKEDGAFYILFVPFLSVEELQIDFENTLFNFKPWPEEQLTRFQNNNELLTYLSQKDNPLWTKRLVLNKSLCHKDIINAGFIHGDIYFSNRIIEAFEKEHVIGYQILQPNSIGTTPLYFSKEDTVD